MCFSVLILLLQQSINVHALNDHAAIDVILATFYTHRVLYLNPQLNVDYHNPAYEKATKIVVQ